MNNYKILLSICMPTYNRKSHIERQIAYFIKELKNIDKRKIEILISNNASTDGTTEYLTDISKDSRLDWLKINNNKENIGAYNNMQFMLKHAQGEYIWMPGDDDYLKTGLLKSILECIENNKPNYIYLSCRSICEKTKHVSLSGKRLQVKYDNIISLNHQQLVNLVSENFSNLKFQTSNIFRKRLIMSYEQDFQTYNFNIQENCHSIYRAIRSIQEGNSYFFSDIKILSGDVISWSDRFIEYNSILDPMFIDGLCNFYFSQKDVNNIKRKQLASKYLFYLRNTDLKRKWNLKGRPGFNYSLYPTVIFLIIRKILSLIGFSKSHKKVKIKTEDFIYN